MALSLPAAAQSPPPPGPHFTPPGHATSQRGYVDPASGEPVPRQVLRAFDKPERNWHAGHRGVDLDLPVGGLVRAAGAGQVAFAGQVAGRPSVSIDHPDGLRTTYTPVFARVQAGDAVTPGQVIGTLAPSFDGYPGLHWGALQGKDDYLNPLELLDAPLIRLQPVTIAGA